MINFEPHKLFRLYALGFWTIAFHHNLSGYFERSWINHWDMIHNNMRDHLENHEL